MTLSRDEVVDRAANWYYMNFPAAFTCWYAARDHAEAILKTVEETEPEMVAELAVTKNIQQDLRDMLTDFDVAYWEG